MAKFAFIIVTIGLSIFSLFDSTCSVTNSKSKQLPNVLFIVVDDLRTTLGCYGESILKTQNVDNLAKKSILFEQAYVQQAICGPSRVSFLTSRRPDTTRLYDFYSYWRVHAGNYTTLPQHFKENGYITQSVAKVFHPNLASNYSDDSPYSWTNTPYHPSTDKYKMSKVCPNPDGTLAMNIVCPVDVQKMPEKSLPDIQTADFAVQFLQNISESKSNQPFFLAVGFQKPHVPLKYPQEYLDLYPLSEIQLAKYHTYPLRLPLVAWNPWTDLREREDVQKLNISFPFGPVPDHFQLLMRQSYYAATSYMDYQLGRVLEALEKHGYSENTIISFIGDHGWALGEHQEWSKYSVFEVAARVPFLIYIPGITYKKGHKNEKVFPLFDPFKAMQAEGSSKVPGELVEAKTMKFESEKIANRKNAQTLEQKFLDTLVQKEGTITRKHASAAYTTSALVELVDLFPTLAEAAGLPTLPLCPEDPFHTMLCTEGASFMPLIKNITQRAQNSQISSGQTSINIGQANSNYLGHSPEAESFKSLTDSLAQNCSNTFMIVSQAELQWKSAVFSQYPRPSVEPREDSDKPHLTDIRIMGYSMWTADFHYTEWVGFIPDNYTILWEEIYGRELYLRTSDPYEINNVALFEECFPLVAVLSKQLHAGWRIALPK